MMNVRWTFACALGVCANLALLAGCSDDGDDGTNGSGGTSANGGSSSGGSGGSSGGAGGTAGSGASGGTTGSGGTGGSGGTAGSGATGGSGGAGGAGDTARLRVVHLSPDAPAVDVFANDATPAVVSELPFPDGTEYLEVPAGSYDFDVAATGGMPDDAVLSLEGIELMSGMSYSAVAYDELASIKGLALVDDVSDIPSGDIRIRAVHVATAVGEVDIWDITDAESPAPLYENVDFGVAGDALDVPAGAYTIGIDVDDDATPDLTFVLPELAAGTSANVFAVNDDEDAVFLFVQLDDGTTATIDPE